jgi:hypothetical protein
MLGWRWLAGLFEAVEEISFASFNFISASSFLRLIELSLYFLKARCIKTAAAFLASNASVCVVLLEVSPLFMQLIIS